MCGIIGYTGASQALPILVHGIHTLSYRGYDSAGVSIFRDGALIVRKDKGRIGDLAPTWSRIELAGTCGIGHTRWATHGEPSQKNAHPQVDASEGVALVHNGILENDIALREGLEAEGVVFASDTDTEVFAHLFSRNFDGDPIAAARVLLEKCHGHFALAIQHHLMPDTLIAVRRGSPLLVGLGVGENLVASDVLALVGRAYHTIEMADEQIAVVTPESATVYDKHGNEVEVERKPLDASELTVGKEGFPHYMLKEIHEQPERLYELITARMDLQHDHVRLDDLGLDDDAWRSIERVDLIGCGTAHYACFYGAYVLEALAGIPTRALQAHEYDARLPVIDDKTLVIAVSQSGETADTKVAVDLAVSQGARTIGVLNVRESFIGRAVDGVLDIHAGREVGVASTKAYTSMLTALLLLTLRAAEARGRGDEIVGRLGRAMRGIPQAIRQVMLSSELIGEVAREIHRANNMLFLGRGADATTALEGALKMKEISYIHAEGYAAGEMKHGPIALVSWEVPTVAIATAGPWRDRMIGNMREIRAREGLVIAVAADDDDDAPKVADFVLPVPTVDPWIAPIVNVVPLQLLAYETAKRRGCDIDQPRNLAKTVTVQ
ncbi:MAG: glutamine--fructose-6-phosphate transaminase (isomerizing) [Planctomycetota bacterium]|nr:glutamine--fructose-6-phosphate transaminase (isomerizing) [Planctomycetota bacterium]